MAINPDRPIITYENVALFQSQTPAHSAVSNSGSNLSFLPLVQGIDFSVDIPRTNVGALGTKDFIDQSNRNAPDVNLTINTFEDFGNLFSGLVSGANTRDDLNIDRNFYAVIGNERSVDVSGENLSGRDVLSFGNCFLNNVSLSQSVNGLINSSYSYVGSNLQADQFEDRIIYFNDYEHLDVGDITPAQLSDDLGIITVTDSAGGFDAITATVSSSGMPGTKSLRMWDGATSTVFQHIYSGVPEDGNYLISGTFRTENGARLSIKMKSGTSLTPKFINSSEPSGSGFLASGYVTTDGYIILERNGDSDSETENVFISDVTIRNLNNRYETSCPSIDLTGNQQQNLVSYFDSGVDFYYSNSSDRVVPHYSTNITISGSNSVGNFLIKSDSIQDFDLNLPINRKTIYSLGKKYPVARKALFPIESTFNFSNRVSSFEVDGERANLKDFLNTDETYTLNINGTHNVDGSFNLEIENAKLISQSYNSAIGSDVVADLGFSFFAVGNAGGDSQASDSASLSAPTNLIAYATSTSSVALLWTAVSGATSYKVLRDGEEIASGVTSSNYTDSSLAENTSYTYTVKAVNAGGESPASDSASTQTPQVPRPYTPTGLTATAQSSSSIALSWNAVGGATSYKVLRDGEEIASGVTSSNYTDSSLAANTSYTYTVKAVNTSGDSLASDSAVATTHSEGGGTENSFQYFRFSGANNDGTAVNGTADWINISDIKLFEDGGTEYPTSALTSDTSENGITISAGTYHSNHAPWKAFDNSNASFWWILNTSPNSDEGNHWLQIDLGESRDITGIDIQSYGNTYTNVDKLIIYASNDGSTFTEWASTGWSSIPTNNTDYLTIEQQT